MKNLLSLASIIISMTLISCLDGNNKNADKNENLVDSSHMKLPVDTMSEVVGEITIGDSIQVDTTVIEEKTAKPDNTATEKKVIKHNSPDQKEIDRIKAEKNKKKK